MQYAKRPRYVHEFVLVDGMGRAGKFMLANIVAAFEGMEFLQEAVLLDHLLHLTRLGKLDIDTCEILLHTHIDLLAHYMMIGRNLNGRIHDLSAISNAPEPERFLIRALIKDENQLTQSILAEQRRSLFISHDALCNARILFKVFPRIKMLHVVRDPIAVIHSWNRRQWGRRIGSDPRAFDVNFSRAGGPIPWFAVDWKIDYQALPELERVVYSVYSILQKARAEYEDCAPSIKGRILFVAYEEMLREPRASISRIADFLGRRPTEQMEAILRRERLPRQIPEDSRQRTLEEIKSVISLRAQEILERLTVEFEEYWRRLVTSK